MVILKLPLADIELNEISPDVLLLVKVTDMAPLLLPTVMVPKLIVFGVTLNIANALTEKSVSSKADKYCSVFDISLGS